MLEKILEEIEEAMIQEDAPIYCGNMEVDGYIRVNYSQVSRHGFA